MSSRKSYTNIKLPTSTTFS